MPLRLKPPPRILPSIPEEISSRFSTSTEHIACDGAEWTMLVVRDTNVLVDAITPSDFARDERLPYWAELWTSSIALARHVRRRADLSGRTVLDLGCGLGLTGIAEAQAGASVVMTDYDEDALAFSRWNLEANLAPAELARVALRLFDWRAPDRLGEFSLITGADIVYERQLFPALLALFRRHLAPGGTVLLADPDRSIGRDFLGSAEADGFTVRSTLHTVERRGIVSRVVLSELARKEDER
jgi:ETFB lysine methyltransferase